MPLRSFSGHGPCRPRSRGAGRTSARRAPWGADLSTPEGGRMRPGWCSAPWRGNAEVPERAVPSLAGLGERLDCSGPVGRTAPDGFRPPWETPTAAVENVKT